MKNIKKFILNWWPPYLHEKIKEQDQMIKNLCDDWAEDDTHIENLCFKYGFTEDQVYGDSYFSLSLQDKVDLLVTLIKQ